MLLFKLFTHPNGRPSRSFHRIRVLPDYPNRLGKQQLHSEPTVLEQEILEYTFISFKSIFKLRHFVTFYYKQRFDEVLNVYNVSRKLKEIKNKTIHFCHYYRTYILLVRNML